MTISLTPNASLLRLILLLQSHRQALSWFATLAVTLVIIYFASIGLKLNRMPSLLIFSTVTFGSAFSLVFALPFRLSVAPSVENLERQIRIAIENAGYRLAESYANSPNVAFYVQKGPSWLTWRESDIKLTIDANCLNITGPLLTLVKLRTVAQESLRNQ